MAECEQVKQEYLWVNKDRNAHSLSSSDRAEKLRIFQFVQHRRASQPAEKPSSYSRRYLLPRNTSDTTKSSASTIRRLRPLSIRPSSRGQGPAPASSQHPPSRHESHPHENATTQASSPRPVHEWIVRLRHRRQNIPRLTYISGSGVDPFSATPLPMTKNVEVLLKYYFIMAPTGSHVDKGEVLPAHLQPIRRYIIIREGALRNCIQDKIEFSGLMLVMAARMVHLSRIPLTGFSRPEVYMHQTLSAVREKMVDCQWRGLPGDRTLVHGIHCLALAEWISQQFEAASTHIQALKLLLPLLDPEDPMDVFIAEGVAIIDRLISIETGWVPDLPLMFDPGPLEPSRMAAIRKDLSAFASGQLADPIPSLPCPIPEACNLTSAIMSHQVDFLADASTSLDLGLGAGFERALAANVIHPALAPILRDLLDVLAVAKYVWLTPYATREDADWMCKRVRAICHGLLALPVTLPSPESSTYSRRTEALRIALLLVVVRCTNRMSFRSAQPNMRRLQRALYGIDTNWSTTTTTSSPLETPIAPATESGMNASQEQGQPCHHLLPLPHDAYNENELLLWILLTGHFGAEGEPEDSWFMMRAAFVAERHLGIRDYEGLRELMGQYLYSRTQQEQSLMVVAMHLAN